MLMIYTLRLNVPIKVFVIVAAVFAIVSLDMKALPVNVLSAQIIVTIVVAAGLKSYLPLKLVVHMLRHGTP